MAVLDVVLYPDDPLTGIADPIEAVDAEITDLAQDMLETMITFDGVGLAGPQVGVSKRILVLCEPEGQPMCLVNPIIKLLGERVEGEEGCLSLPQIYAIVPRAERVQVKALDERGKRLEFDASDFLARIIQHECDHLEGLVFPDRLDILSREATTREWEAMREQLLAAAQSKMG